MNANELEHTLIMAALDNGLNREDIKVVKKDELVVGVIYPGHCRNASKAKWLGDKFEYERYKWGSTYTEKINHFEDDDGYDVFVPYKRVWKQ